MSVSDTAKLLQNTKAAKTPLSVISLTASLNLLFVKQGLYILAALHCECFAIHAAADE